jgi:predicted transcriptional regulator
MSLFATVLRKVENKFDKNTTQYFYLFTVIATQKIEKKLDKNLNIWYKILWLMR